MDERSGLEIAVVGMSARFPGAPSVDDYWDVVSTGREVISTFTDEELAQAGVDESVRRNPAYVPAAGLLTEAEYFDAGFFGLSPRDAAVLDPQHRLFLQCAWHALEDAGYARNPERHLVGVYAGSSFSTYMLRHLLPNSELMRDLSEHELLLSNDRDTLAMHAAYHLNLTGPAISVQTACSTSLVAVHLAGQGLLAGDCDLALAGGVSVQPPQTEGYLYKEGGIMSPDGHCRPFDATGQGTLIGSGVGVVVLKRLTDALRDRDTIHAVITGTAINNDGSAKPGFTAPSVGGQATVIRNALSVAGIGARTIGYVEAHGTATALGDPMEVAGLTEAYRESTDERGYCALGSVKSLIGHADTAAGIAGLIKAILTVREGVLPPSPYFTEPNPALALAESPFYVNPELREWPGELRPRRAAVSSFGMGGTNAHAIVQEPPAPSTEVPPDGDGAGELLLLSARSAEALSSAGARLREFLVEREDVALSDVGHTLRVGRRDFPHRLAVECHSRAEAVARLGGKQAKGRWSGVARNSRREVAFLFPGQGAQHPGMALDLYERRPVFRRHLDECAELLRPHLDRELLDLLRAPESESVLGQTRYTQPALFAVEYALARLWQEWGVRPTAMLGHSVGEFTAACLAGCFELPDALGLVAARGRLMQTLPPGSMLAVSCPAEQLSDLLVGGLCLAAANAPRLSVVSGPTEEIEPLAAELRDKGITCRSLHTSHAFHSSMMDPILDAFAEHVARVPLHEPGIPFISGATGEPMTGAQATDPAYWVHQLRQPVRFSEGLRALTRDPDRILLEVGPGTTLTTLARQHDLADGGHSVVGSLPHPREPRRAGSAMTEAFGRLWAAGVPVDTAAFAAPARRVPLPGYPFEQRRFWYDLPASGQVGPAPAGRPHPSHLPTVPTPPEAPEAVVDAADPVDGAPGPGGDDQATAARIRRVWQQLLGIPEIGGEENFFELGGHSLLAIQVIARLREDFGVDLPAGVLFEAPTIDELTSCVDELLADEAAELADALLGELDGLTDDELRYEFDRIHNAKDQS